MDFRNFRFSAPLRILILSASIACFVHLVYRTSLYAVFVVLGVFIIYQIHALIRYVEKSNRDIVRFLQAIKYEDFSETFSSGGRGASFQKLSDAFNDVTQEIRRVRSEREENFRYLQTVVQHVGIGVISFQQDGEVELMNRTAKQLLGVRELKNIHSLESFSKPFVDMLMGMESGDRELMKIKTQDGDLQLAVNAAQFKMRNKKFTLVSLQDIRSELERERMGKELEIGHQVQMKLLPKESPKLSGFDISSICIPAKEVGGDFFDYIRFGKGKLGVAVGDVAGKGVPAAIYMTLTKGALQSYAGDGIFPKDVLGKINSLMYQSIERGAFVSMCYAILDEKMSRILCSRAGHNPAIHYRVKEDRFTFIQPEGIALGLEKGDVFDRIIKDEEIQLNKGDLFIFYTDGFTDAMNKEREDYGEERLLDVIRRNKEIDAKSLIRAVCDDVQGFTEGYPQYDDMTMVVIKVGS